MKFSWYFLVVLLITGFVNKSESQMLRENEMVVIKGEKFILHQIRTGETVYSISRQYQIESKILSEHNPKIAEGLKIGDVLKIPYNEGVEWQKAVNSQNGDPDYFEYYTISSRTETPYFISREFGITVEQIYAYNPEVSRFRKGTKLRIPRWGIPPATIAKEAVEGQQQDITERDLILYEVQQGETLKSIAQRFRISEREILFFNPEARKLTPGSVIHLPRPADETGRKEHAEYRKQAGSDYSGREVYFEHTIVSGETMWSVTRKYDVTEFELKRMNPMLESGFPAGMTIKIPVKEDDLSTAEPVNENAFTRHVVQPGETLFGLSSSYNLSIPDLRRFNPHLANRNLVQGETLLIPKREFEKISDNDTDRIDSLRQVKPQFESRYYEVELPVVIPENCQRNDYAPVMASTYDVVLFLPLFVHANDASNQELVEIVIPIDSMIFEGDDLEEDTLIEMDEPEELFYTFYGESENYLKFYEGVLIAVDSLQRAGLQIVLHVFDTQQNPEFIRKYIYTSNFLETDLIIGPVFPNVQEEVAAIAAKNRIPIVSPLSNQSLVLNSNPFYYQVNPTREFIISKTAELITEEYFNSNFVVIKTTHSGNAVEEKVVDMVREKLMPTGYFNNPRGLLYKEINFSRDGVAGLRSVLSKEKENVVFISSMNEGDLSIVLSNLNNLARSYSVTLIGFNRYEQFRSIQEEFYHNLNLHFIAPYWADYSNPETVHFVKAFRQHFNTEPGNFGMQGFDVAFYFLNALKNFGKDFEECLTYQQVHLAQGSYIFEKQSPFGGYMNQGVSVISYEPNFEVVRKRVIGPFRFAQR